MSVPAEQMKPRRGRPPKNTDTPQEIPEFSCSIPTDTYYEMSINGQDKIKKHHVCQHEAKWFPFITFIGQRREENPPGSKVYVVKDYKFPIRYAPICDFHREEIEKNLRILVSGAELESQVANMKNIGLPSPNPKLTKLTFQPFVAPESDIPSDHLSALIGEYEIEDE